MGDTCMKDHNGHLHITIVSDLLILFNLSHRKTIMNFKDNLTTWTISARRIKKN